MADGLTPQTAQSGMMMPGQTGEALSGTVEQGPPISNIQKSVMKNRRLILFAAATLMFMGFVGLMIWSSETPYRTIYSGMTEKDASAIVELLQKEKIPYKLQGAGTVLVPEDQVYAVRLKLAGEDMVPGNGGGFELFDRANEFGISDFTQKVNLQRAMQVELSTTIEVLPQVAAARVHLVMPKESAFAERDRKASASVMLQLTGNKKMSKKSVEAIQSLVASAVPELDRSDVTVVDSSGNMLSATDENKTSGEGQGMIEYQAKLEQGYEMRLTSMLEQVVGAGQAIVRVTTDINREYVESNAQIYNPDEQVLRSSKAIEEQRRAVDAAPMGVPGMVSNNPEANVNPDGSLATQEPPSEQASRNETTQNFEISSKTEHRIIPFGSIEKVSIAVIVGGSYKEGADGAKVFVPRTAQELNSLKTLIQNAVGFNEDRGDTVEVQSMPLLDISGNDMSGLDSDVDRAFYLELLRYGLAAMALFLVAWFVMRPIAKRIKESAEEEKNLALGLAPDGSPLAVGGSAHAEQMKRAREAIMNDPNRASRVVNEWVSSV